MQSQESNAFAQLPFQRLPDIDYSKHPLYARYDGGIGFVDRLVGFARYVQILAYLVGLRAYHVWQRRSYRPGSDTPYLDVLRCDGFVQGRFAGEDRAAIVSAAQPYFDRLEAHRAGIERGRRGYGDGQVDTTRGEAPALHRAVERALEASGVLASVRAYLGCQAEIRTITVQMNDQWDTHWRGHFEKNGLPIPDTAFFHVDNTYGVVKVIMYVSEVTETSGPFSYVPGTNRIEYGPLEGLLLRATDIWVDVWPQHRRQLLTLPRSFRKKAKFGDDIPADASWGRWLLENERFMTSAGGDLLLFDVMGIHRGGMIRSGERRILQILMR
jgi:hypothetical protein